MYGPVLLRHPEVARAWQGRCYGASDMGLSRAGRAALPAIIEALRTYRIKSVVHSGLRRAREPAIAIAIALNLPVAADHAWRERDFGAWEGRTWNAIWRETGSAMDGMIDDPAGFRPGGGETTHELRDRVLAALAHLAGDALVVSHGGPIATVLAFQSNRPIADLPELIPKCGAVCVCAQPTPRMGKGL